MKIGIEFIIFAFAYIILDLLIFAHYKKYGDMPQPLFFSWYLKIATFFFIIAVAQCQDIIRELTIIFSPQFDFLNYDIFRWLIKPIAVPLILISFSLLSQHIYNKARVKKNKKILENQ